MGFIACVLFKKLLKSNYGINFPKLVNPIFNYRFQSNFFAAGYFSMRFDKKFLGELRKTLPIAMRNFSRNFFCFVVEKILPLPGHSGALRL